MSFAPRRLAPAMILLATVLFAGGALAATDDLGHLTSGCLNTDGTWMPKERIKACSTILTEYPLDPPQEARIRANRAWSLSQEQRLADAQADYDRALQLDPNSAVLYNERGFFHLRIGEFDAAVRDYNSSIILDTKFAYPLFGRGIAYMRKGDLARGEDDLAAARRLDSGIDNAFRAAGVTP